MERILQFADSKTTGERWIFFSENVRKCVNNAAFSNIHNLFSERVNTTFFAVQCVIIVVEIALSMTTYILIINHLSCVDCYRVLIQRKFGETSQEILD